MRDWKLESLANGKEILEISHRSFPNGKRGLPLEEVVYNLIPNGFSGKLLFHLPFNRLKVPDFFAKW